MAWQTFWMERAGWARVALRRYASGATGGMDCVSGFHDAAFWTDLNVPEVGEQFTERPTIDAGDPRWPVACSACPYVFTDADERQVFLESVYRRVDTGELRVLHRRLRPPDVPAAEPGASWHADWMPEKWRGPDGIALMVRCPSTRVPDGQPLDWPVDMPSTQSGGRWSRTGDPRTGSVTARPSISIGYPEAYHGWLTGGVLSDPL